MFGFSALERIMTASFVPTATAVSAPMRMAMSVNPFLAASPMGRMIEAAHEMCQYPEEIKKSASLDIPSVRVNGRDCEVKRSLIYAEPYTRFWLYEPANQPKHELRLVLPPNSGQTTFPMGKPLVRALLEKGYPTVVRENIDPENVSVRHGPFGLDDDVSTVRNFVRHVDEPVYAFGQCQAGEIAVRAGCLLSAEGNKNLRHVVTISSPLNPRGAQTKIMDFVDRAGPSFANHFRETIQSGGRLAGDGQVVCSRDKLRDCYIAMNPMLYAASAGESFLALMNYDRKKYNEICEAKIKLDSTQHVPFKLFDDIGRRVFRGNLFVRDLETHEGRPISGRDFKGSILYLGSLSDSVVHYNQATPKGLLPNAHHAKAFLFKDYEHFQIIANEGAARKIVSLTETFHQDCAERARPRPRSTLREGLACALTGAQDIKIAANG